ncbi:LOW QUALITY PROTEIN: hypothetical protein BC938DRAFT_478258 [Jimgerdemannia flammicorona]|uniref:Uncharacterized protein n=1 Tax=Jimgerdemannia flammicorona TaxID=994334 RepID=A0A433P652_9FUNG|nr:LOW QUALITY PROTEIN: hypothetical protein BC938DRAFT_478258 [Jimgerdemannia flammicorona]
MAAYGYSLLPYSIGNAVHPLIHLGFGIELQRPLIVSEALAYTCIKYSPYGDLVEPEVTTGGDLSPFEIFEAIRLDPAFDTFPTDLRSKLSDEQVALVKTYLDKWNVGDNTKSLDDHLYSLAHAILLLYITTTTTTSPKPDFFLMHLLTSFHAYSPSPLICALRDTVQIALPSIHHHIRAARAAHPARRSDVPAARQVVGRDCGADDPTPGRAPT